MFRVVIVDDEPSAVNNLKWELEHFTDEVKVIETFTSAEEAIHGINYLKPDCVFLDIEMPGKDGFTLLNDLVYKNFNLIITTAYENYAIRAFKENAIDYLLKPIDVDDLKAAIQRIKDRNTAPDLSHEIQRIVNTTIQAHEGQDKIFLPIDGKIIMVSAASISYCKSDGNYTEVYSEDTKKLLLTKNLKQVTKMITNPNFVRVHQSYLININHIREYNKGDGGYLIMNDQTNIPVSRSYKNNLIAKLKIF